MRPTKEHLNQRILISRPSDEIGDVILLSFSPSGEFAMIKYFDSGYKSWVKASTLNVLEVLNPIP